MAQRMHVTTIELDASHCVDGLQSRVRPTDLILQAADA